MALIKCPDCGKMISSRALKCPDCGCPVVVEKPKMVCPECGEVFSEGDSKCANCGFPIKTKEPIISNRQNMDQQINSESKEKVFSENVKNINSNNRIERILKFFFIIGGIGIFLYFLSHSFLFESKYETELYQYELNDLYHTATIVKYHGDKSWNYHYLPREVRWGENRYKVTKIGDRALLPCHSANLVVPETVTELGEECFPSYIGITLPKRFKAREQSLIYKYNPQKLTFDDETFSGPY